MWVEAVLAKNDLIKLADQLSPLEIQLGEAGGTLRLTDPREISLIPAVGVRVACTGHLHWPVLGMQIPVTFHTLTMRVIPEIDKREGGDALVFKLEIEHADVSALPSIVDDEITDLINRELAKKGFELAWNFAETLSHVFAVPELLTPIVSLGIKVRSGTVRATSEALVLAVSFGSEVRRAEESTTTTRDELEKRSA